MSVPAVYVSGRAARRLAQDHPWVYRSDIEDDGEHASGDLVAVEKRHGRGGTNRLGWAFYSHDSLIALRMITRGEEMPADDFFRDRLALPSRREAGCRAKTTQGGWFSPSRMGCPA